MTTKKKSVDLSRRDLLRRSAIGAATVGGVSAGAIRLDHGPVQNSQAIAPAVVAGGVGTSMAVGWALREFEVIGSDSPPEGLTGDGLRNQAFTTTRTRKSTNASTIIDNQNIIENLRHTLYSDGKKAAIEAINDGADSSGVNQAATDAIDDYTNVIFENLVSTWNESMHEFRTLYEAIQDHPDISPDGILNTRTRNITTLHITNEKELPTGKIVETEEASSNEFGSGTGYLAPYGNHGSFDSSMRVDVNRLEDYDFEEFRYLNTSRWSSIWDDLTDVYNETRDGIIIWADNAYDALEAGDIDSSDLLTSRELADMTSEDEDYPQAIADLNALNIGIDLEREAEIYFPDVEATAYGQLLYSGEKALSVGTVDPDATDDNEEPIYPGTIYFTYDISQGEGVWSAYQDDVDGGTVTLTSEPFVETVYSVTTTAGETVSFRTDDLDEDELNEEWTVDLSNDLDDQTTEVESIEYYSDVDGTQYETIQLRDTFEIIDFTDSDGNSYEETLFERSEPHTDDNYITEEEWKEQQERHEELIQKYEDAGGIGIGIGGGDGGTIAAAVGVGAVLFALLSGGGS